MKKGRGDDGSDRLPAPWRQSGQGSLRSVVIYGFAAQAAGVLANSTFGMFAAPVASHFGVTRVALAFGLYSLIHGLAAPMAGLTADRVGPRPVRIVGGALLTCGFALGAAGGSIVTYYIGIGLLCGVGHAMFAGPPLNLSLIASSNGPDTIRAFGLVTAGAGVGALLAVPLSSHAIGTVGWQVTYLGYAVVVVCVMTVGEMALRANSGSGSTQLTISRRAAREVRWQSFSPNRDLLSSAVASEAKLIIANCASGAQRTLIVVVMIPWSVARGVDLGIAVGVFAVGEGLRVLGSVLITQLGSHVSSRIGYASSSLVAGGGVAFSLALASGENVWALAVGTVIYGLASGGIHPLGSAMEAEVFVPSRRGLLVGMSSASYGVGGAMAVAANTWILARGASWDASVVIIIGALIALAAMVLSVPSDEGSRCDQA